jgi:hypothetical protein
MSVNRNSAALGISGARPRSCQPSCQPVCQTACQTINMVPLPAPTQPRTPFPSAEFRGPVGGTFTNPNPNRNIDSGEAFIWDTYAVTSPNITFDTSAPDTVNVGVAGRYTISFRANVSSSAVLGVSVNGTVIEIAGVRLLRFLCFCIPELFVRSIQEINFSFIVDIPANASVRIVNASPNRISTRTLIRNTSVPPVLTINRIA